MGGKGEALFVVGTLLFSAKQANAMILSYDKRQQSTYITARLYVVGPWVISSFAWLVKRRELCGGAPESSLAVGLHAAWISWDISGQWTLLGCWFSRTVVLYELPKHRRVNTYGLQNKNST